MSHPGQSGVRWIMAGVVALLGCAVWVRGLEVERPPDPEDLAGDQPRIEEPMQLLGSGSRFRHAELDAWVSEEPRGEWLAVSRMVFSIGGCPALYDWAGSRAGQRFELLLERLRGGTRDDGLAALTLIFRVARSTRWESADDAERLAGLLQEWLRAWAESSAQDPVLHEPALAAALLYGSAMRAAWNAPIVGYNRASLERARDFLGRLCGVGAEGGRTSFGEALQARFSRAFGSLSATDDSAFLRAFGDECALLLPDLDGECDS